MKKSIYSTFKNYLFNSKIFAGIFSIPLIIGICMGFGCSTFTPVDSANAALASQPAEKNQFVIMSTSDMHGKCWDFDNETKKEAPQNYLSASTAINKIREQFGERNILFDNGDIYQGTDISTQNLKVNARGSKQDINPCTLCLEKIKYDGATLGNHEFDYEWETMNKQYNHLKSNGTNIVCANIYNEATGQRVFPAWMTKNINVDGQDITIAVIGLENTDIPRWCSTENYPGLIFHAPENTTCDLTYEINKAKADMKAACINPDFTVVCMHSGIYDYDGVFDPTAAFDKEKYKQTRFDNALSEPLVPYINTENQVAHVARNTSGIDLIISGHDHIDWYSGYQTTNADNKKIPIVNSATHDLTKTVFNIEKNSDGKLLFNFESTDNLKLENFQADTNLKKIIQPYAEKTSKYVNEEIGILNGTWDDGKKLESKDIYYKQNDSMDLINRAQIDHPTKVLKQKYETVDKLNEYLSQKFPDKDYKISGDEIKVDFSISSNPIKSQAKTGTVTRSDMNSLYRYDNILYVIPVKGQDILDILNFNADSRLQLSEKENQRQLTSTGDMYTFCIPYGLNFTYDMNKPANQKVITETFSNGKIFDVNATYLMAINNYQIGNTFNNVTAKFNAKDAVYNQIADDGQGYTIQDIVAEYTQNKTKENGAVYNTKESQKNNENPSTWKIIF